MMAVYKSDIPWYNTDVAPLSIHHRVPAGSAHVDRGCIERGLSRFPDMGTPSKPCGAGCMGIGTRLSALTDEAES